MIFLNCQALFDRQHSKTCKVTISDKKLHYFQLSDPCNDYKDTKDDTTAWQRSTGYIIPKNSQTSKSDRRGFTNGWYRFTSPAGGEMPTTCPKERACGKCETFFFFAFFLHFFSF